MHRGTASGGPVETERLTRLGGGEDQDVSVVDDAETDGLAALRGGSVEYGLRVSQVVMRELIAAGYELAGALLDPEAARLPFLFSDLLLQRHEVPLAVVAQRAAQLLQQLEPLSLDRCPLDAGRVRMWRSELLIEARLPAWDPPLAEENHFAVRWMLAMRAMLRARRYLEHKQVAAAQRELRAAEPLLSFYPDLAQIHCVFAVVATEQAGERARLLQQIRARVWPQIESGCTAVLDLSTPLWCLGWLLLFAHTRPGLWGELAQEIELLAQTLAGAPWLSDTLLDRGLGRDALAQLRSGHGSMTTRAVPDAYLAALARFCTAVHP